MQLLLLLRGLLHAMSDNLVSFFEPYLGDLSDHVVLGVLPLAELSLDLDDGIAKLRNTVPDPPCLSLELQEMNQLFLCL